MEFKREDFELFELEKTEKEIKRWTRRIVIGVIIFFSFMILLATYSLSVSAEESYHGKEYQRCIFCHELAVKGKLKKRAFELFSQGLEKSKNLWRRGKECFNPGDQGCMDAATDKTGKFLKGAKEFLRETWEKSK